MVSPLVDIRSRIVNRGNVELFTVDSPTPRYLALTALGSFDGTRWSTLTEDVRPADGALGSIPVVGETITEQITISKLAGSLAPAARTATAATWQGDRNMLWADQSGALYVDGGLQPGYTYQVTSVDNDPSPDQLRTATVSGAPEPVYYELPKSLPKEIRDLAQEVTADATTPYDKAIALQNWFRTQFKYSLTVQRGHSNDAMLNFLSIRTGYCEQFSGTFAAMARALDLPTRVMVGFTQGQLGADHLYHVAGRHAHAWDEVWFDGYGWVLFDPTPGRGAPGAEGHTGVAPEQETGSGTRGGNDQDCSDAVGVAAYHSGTRSARGAADTADHSAQPGAATTEQRRFEQRLDRRRHRDGDHRLGHRHAAGDQPVVATPGQERRRPCDLGVGRHRALIDDGRRASRRRLDPARVRQVGRLRQGRGNRDRSTRDPRCLLAPRSRRRCRRTQ